MNTYAVKFLKGADMQLAYVQGTNQSEAGKEFFKIYPDIDPGKTISVDNIQEQSNDYGVSITVAKIISFFGWISVFAGIVLIIMALAEAVKSGGFGIGTMLALYPASVAIVGGLVLVITGQVSRAVMDNANYSKQMLDETRNRK